MYIHQNYLIIIIKILIIKKNLNYVGLKLYSNIVFDTINLSS
jgi:hypothetical protein